jgi:hypothetical protein
MKIDLSFIAKHDNSHELDNDSQIKLRKFLAKRKKEISNHFKKDEWDLDFRFLLDEAIQELLGVDLYGAVAKNYVTKNVSLIYKDNRTMLVKEKKNDTKTRKKTKAKRK